MSSQLLTDLEAESRPMAAERRSALRYPGTQLVVVRLMDPAGHWRWYWVTDIGAGGLAVSFLAGAPADRVWETTLLDVSRALSFSVALRSVWHQDEPPTRTGFRVVRADPGLKRWLEQFAEAPRRRAHATPGGSWQQAPG